MSGCGKEQMTATENPALSELLHSLRPGMSPMEQLDAVTRAYEIGRGERGQPSDQADSTFLDATAQQIMPYCLETAMRGSAAPVEVTHATAARFAYDAASALLAERARRQCQMGQK